MEFFKSMIGILAYASLGFSLTAAYLKINKVWKRKHNVEVANSVSVAGNVIDIIPLSFFALNYFFVAQWQGVIGSSIWIVAGGVLVLIGSGFWVQGNRDKNFWTRMKESLRLERAEVGHLATTFFRPSGAEIILEILAHLAYIDRKLEDSEQKMIQSFADTWHLKIDWSDYQKLADLEQPVSFVTTRDTVSRYLKTSPPEKQVAQLIDVLRALAMADETVSTQENLILEEIHGLLLAYISGSDMEARYTVVIAPQNRDQDTAIKTILPNVEKTEVAGGAGYLVGSFFTQDYANVICEQYRALGFFTIDMVGDDPVVVK